MAANAGQNPTWAWVALPPAGIESRTWPVMQSVPSADSYRSSRCCSRPGGSGDPSGASEAGEGGATGGCSSRRVGDGMPCSAGTLDCWPSSRGLPRGLIWGSAAGGRRRPPSTPLRMRGGGSTPTAAASAIARIETQSPAFGGSATAATPITSPIRAATELASCDPARRPASVMPRRTRPPPSVIQTSPGSAAVNPPARRRAASTRPLVAAAAAARADADRTSGAVTGPAGDRRVTDPGSMPPGSGVSRRPPAGRVAIVSRQRCRPWRPERVWRPCRSFPTRSHRGRSGRLRRSCGRSACGVRGIR